VIALRPTRTAAALAAVARNYGNLNHFVRNWAGWESGIDPNYIVYDAAVWLEAA
jgi:hypothetical protein